MPALQHVKIVLVAASTTAAQPKPEATHLARVSLLAYCSAVDPTYRPGRHHALIAAALEGVERGDIPRLIVLAPPRHGKSREVSELFPAWWRGRNPRYSIIQATYAQDLADDFGRKVKALVASEEHLAIFPGSATDPSSDSIRRFHSVAGGAYVAAGVGGPITGRGGHLLILDDPYKNRQEAESPVIRKSTWDWYTSVFRTRIMYWGKAGAIVIVLTHWHAEDVAGMLLRQQAMGGVERWLVLDLKARAEEGDVLGRKVGEPLWPEGGYGEEFLTSTESAVGPRDWAALYQQRPSSAEGNIFLRDRWGRWCPAGCQEQAHRDAGWAQLPEDLGRPMQSWDMSFKGTQESDFVVGLVGARDGNGRGGRLFLLDRVKERAAFPRTIAMVRDVCARWPRSGHKWVESKANGPAVVAELKDEIPGMQEVDPSEIGGGKDERWNAAAPEQNAGNILVPGHALWSDEFIESCAAVPATDYDDDADALAMLVLKGMSDRGRAVIKLLGSMVEDRRAAEALVANQKSQAGGAR